MLQSVWHCRVVSVLHCPQISSLIAASLDKTLSLTDLERCIAVRRLMGEDAWLKSVAYADPTCMLGLVNKAQVWKGRLCGGA